MVHEICENPDSQKIARIFFPAFLKSKADFHIPGGPKGTPPPIPPPPISGGPKGIPPG